jgi:hypothetical protein
MWGILLEGVRMADAADHEIRTALFDNHIYEVTRRIMQDCKTGINNLSQLNDKTSLRSGCELNVKGA